MYQEYLGKLCKIEWKDGGMEGVVAKFKNDKDGEWLVVDYGYGILTKAITNIQEIKNQEAQR